MIQELGVARQLALGAQVLRGLHQADAEELLPEAVDRDPRRQGVSPVDEPFGQVPTGGDIAFFLHGREEGRGVSLDLLAGVIVLPALSEEGLANFGALLHHHGLRHGALECAPVSYTHLTLPTKA